MTYPGHTNFVLVVCKKHPNTELIPLLCSKALTKTRNMQINLLRDNLSKRHSKLQFILCCHLMSRYRKTSQQKQKCATLHY